MPVIILKAAVFFVSLIAIPLTAFLIILWMLLDIRKYQEELEGGEPF